MERIVITFTDAGQFRGASVTDFNGQPKPLDIDGLADIFPILNSAALERVEELEAELAEITPGKDSLQSQLDTANARIAELEAWPEVEVIPDVTPLTIITRLVDLGKWPEFEAILSAFPSFVEKSFYAAQTIEASHPLFLAYVEEFKAGLDLTDEEFTALLTP